MIRKILFVLMACTSVLADSDLEIPGPAAATYSKQHLQQLRLTQNSTFSNIDRNYSTSAEQTFAQIQAFLIGFRSSLTIPDALNCSIALNSSVDAFNSTFMSWSANNASTLQKVFDTTHWISYGFAPSSRYCIMTGIDSYLYILNQKEAFGNFSTWLPEALQNMLSNVLPAQQVYTKIQAAQNANDTLAETFWIGRLFYMLIVFSPTGQSSYVPVTPSPRLIQQPDSVVNDQWSTTNVPLYNSSGIFQDILGFSEGFLYATFINSAQNISICTGNVTYLALAGKDLKQQLPNIQNPHNISNALADVQEILSTAYPLTYSCFYGANELHHNLNGYLSSAKNAKSIALNLIGYSAEIYDATFYTIRYLRMKKPVILEVMDTRDYYFRLGIYIGIGFNSIFTSERPSSLFGV